MTTNERRWERAWRKPLGQDSRRQPTDSFGSTVPSKHSTPTREANAVAKSLHGRATIRVLGWDNQPSRMDLVAAVATGCGGACAWLKSASDPIKSSSSCFAGIVSLGTPAGDHGAGLEVVRHLKAEGFRVIAYEDGAATWPLGMRCWPLLAGALCLLDSAARNFREELRQALAKVLSEEASRWDEEGRIRVLMRAAGIVGESSAMLSVFKWILRVSVLSDLPALITGESGTGKELVAAAIHRLDGKRSCGPFVAINCAAINPHLVESELFGYRRGAFTGADRDRRGLIRAANGGVMFLDEIGELSDESQAKLLRVLQEGRVLAIGEEREVPVDVRVIAATNRNLDQMIQQRKFRTDLFHRLNALPVHIPPLRERKADVRPLIEHFLAKYRSLASIGTHSVSHEFVEAVSEIELSGNVRELENLVRWALIRKTDHSPLCLADLPDDIWQQLSERQSASPAAFLREHAKHSWPTRSCQTDCDEGVDVYITRVLDSTEWNLLRSLDHCERQFLQAALHHAKGNRTRAAQLLGITPRSVYNKLHKHDPRSSKPV